MKFEQALQAMRKGGIVYNKEEPEIKYGMDNKTLWYECKGMKYYFRDFIGFSQKEILSEDWEADNGKS